MGEVDRSCLGSYENKQGSCDICPVALLCIDITIEVDKYFDAWAERQADIQAMEQDSRWCYDPQSM